MKIIVVLGPTASGKSKLAFDIAKFFNLDLISADSRQIYKELNIITNKDKGNWINGVYTLENGLKEYLVDFLDPRKEYSVQEYQREVYNLLKNNTEANFLLVGGTGFYIDAVLYNYDLDKAVNLDLQKELESKYKKKGLESLVKQLKSLDPNLNINFQNPRKVIRALEYVLNTGEKWSIAQKKRKQSIFESIYLISPYWDRKKLYKRINERVEEMIKEGALEETEFLYKKYGENWPASTSIGYYELIQYIKGNMSLDEAKEKMKQRTRHYAKRQITWFKRMENINYIDIVKYQENRQIKENLLLEIKKFLQK